MASPSAEATVLPGRLLTYSHDGFGLGHMRRNYNIATRFVLTLPGANALMLVSSPPGIFFDLPSGVDYVKLPSIIKVDSDTWSPRTLQLDMAEVIDMRKSMIELATWQFRPDVVLVDYLAAGVQGELLPALSSLRSQSARPRIVLGLRDVLDAPDAVHKSWHRSGFYDVVCECFDAILVYGSPNVVETAALYGLDSAFPGKVQYCGYVVGLQRAMPRAKLLEPLRLSGDPLLVGAVGGGYDAYPTLALTIEALRTLGSAAPDAVLIAGPLLPEPRYRELVRAAEGRPIRVLRSVEDAPSFLAAADVVVAMGSYNTLMEAIGLRRQVIALPRPGPSAEQRMRAERLAALGLIEALEADATSHLALARAILRRLHDPAPVPALDVSGADQVVQRLIGLVRGEGAATASEVG